MRQRRLTVSFEMVTGSHGHHGQLPAGEYLVATSAHSLDPVTQVTRLPAYTQAEGAAAPCRAQRSLLLLRVWPRGVKGGSSGRWTQIPSCATSSAPQQWLADLLGVARWCSVAACDPQGGEGIGAGASAVRFCGRSSRGGACSHLLAHGCAWRVGALSHPHTPCSPTLLPPLWVAGAVLPRLAPLPGGVR